MEFWEFWGMASAQGGRRLQADGVDLTFQIVEDIRLALHSSDHYKPK